MGQAARQLGKQLSKWRIIMDIYGWHDMPKWSCLIWCNVFIWGQEVLCAWCVCAHSIYARYTHVLQSKRIHLEEQNRTNLHDLIWSAWNVRPNPSKSVQHVQPFSPSLGVGALLCSVRHASRSLEALPAAASASSVLRTLEKKTQGHKEERFGYIWMIWMDLDWFRYI